jgi:hypothetical protein
VARAQVPDDYTDEYDEWYEKNANGPIVAWELRL